MVTVTPPPTGLIPPQHLAPQHPPPVCSHMIWVVVQSLSRVWLSATPQTAARQASMSITISRSLLRLMSIESMMPSNHLILCCPLLLLPSIFPSIRVSSNESSLCIRWPKYRMHKQNVVSTYNGLLALKRERISTHCDINGPCYAKWNESVT